MQILNPWKEYFRIPSSFVSQQKGVGGGAGRPPPPRAPSFKLLPLSPAPSFVLLFTGLQREITLKILCCTKGGEEGEGEGEGRERMSFINFTD